MRQRKTRNNSSAPTHSLLGWLIFAALTLPFALWQWTFWLALVFGYGSHLAADACTKSGIPLLHPRKTRYHWLPRSLQLTTGSLAEEALMPLVAVIILFLLFSIYPVALSNWICNFSLRQKPRLLWDRGLPQLPYPQAGQRRGRVIPRLTLPHLQTDSAFPV